jgi:hydrogenase nickel incorporation protein HypA/HybF
MHELSLAQSIVEIVRQYVPNEKAGTVKSVKLKIGELSGVVADSLDFCFSAITADTPLQGATLQIDKIPFTLECNDCSESFTSEYGTVICQRCGGSNTHVLKGTEMQVVEIELIDLDIGLT